jgi:hypothetical protein
MGKNWLPLLRTYRSIPQEIQTPKVEQGRFGRFLSTWSSGRPQRILGELPGANGQTAVGKCKDLFGNAVNTTERKK